MKEIIRNRLLVFHHWPKCGGTSLRHSIEEVFESDELLWCYKWIDNKCNKMQLLPPSPSNKGLLTNDTGKNNFHPIWQSLSPCRSEWHRKIDEWVADGKVKIAFGHIAPLPNSIKSRDAVYWTMMRNPLTRFVSHYNHYVRDLKKSMPKDEPDSFEEFIQRDIFGVIDIDILNRFDRVLFYEEYPTALSEISEFLGKPLTMKQSNIFEPFLERSQETDEIVRKHRRGQIAMYEFAREKHSNG